MDITINADPSAMLLATSIVGVSLVWVSSVASAALVVIAALTRRDLRSRAL